MATNTYSRNKHYNYYPIERIVQEMFEIITDTDELATLDSAGSKGAYLHLLQVEVPAYLKANPDTVTPFAINVMAEGQKWHGKKLNTVKQGFIRNIEEHNLSDKYTVLTNDKAVFVKVL